MSTNGDQRAAYALLVWDGKMWQITHRRVPYEYERTVRAIEASELGTSSHAPRSYLAATPGPWINERVYEPVKVQISQAHTPFRWFIRRCSTVSYTSRRLSWICLL